MLPLVFRLLYGQRSYFGSHSCVRSNSCISWQISLKFCMEVYHGKIYTPIVFGDAAPSVPSFIGSKVIFWWKSCVRAAGHISWRISFKFCTDVQHSQIYTTIVLGDSAPSVLSFIGSKVIFWFTFLFALQQLHFLRDFFQIYTPIVFGDATPSVPSFIGSKVIFWWKSCVRSAGHISWRISFECCM